jgi:hypothetical protein
MHHIIYNKGTWSYQFPNGSTYDTRLLRDIERFIDWLDNNSAHGPDIASDKAGRAADGQVDNQSQNDQDDSGGIVGAL